MTVSDCMREIRMIKDAMDTLDRYASGDLPNIADQHITEIREMLGHYMDMVEQRRVAY